MLLPLSLVIISADNQSCNQILLCYFSGLDAAVGITVKASGNFQSNHTVAGLGYLKLRQPAAAWCPHDILQFARFHICEL